MTDKQPEALAFYVERVAPGMRDDGAKIGLWWKRNAAEEWVDDRHVLRELVSREVVAKKDAAIKELREALRSVSATLAWQCFGDCRLFSAPGEPLLTPAEAEQKSRAALANTEDA